MPPDPLLKGEYGGHQRGKLITGMIKILHASGSIGKNLGHGRSLDQDYRKDAIILGCNVRYPGP